MQTFLKEHIMLRSLCWMWVSGSVLFPETLHESLTLNLLRFRGILLHISFQFTSTLHSSVSTVCSARIFPQLDGSPGQKLLGPQRKHLLLTTPDWAGTPCMKTHICTSILVVNFYTNSTALTIIPSACITLAPNLVWPKFWLLNCFQGVGGR